MTTTTQLAIAIVSAGLLTSLALALALAYAINRVGNSHHYSRSSLTILRYEIADDLNRITTVFKRRVGVLAAISWTDCDGMRGTSFSWHFTRSQALAKIEREASYADGPLFGEVYDAPNGRILIANHVADTRDRYAESEGY